MNEKDSKAIHELFSEFHYSDNLGLLKSKLVDYASTIREEARRAAFKEAIQIAKEEAFERRLAHTVYERLLEAAEKGERDGRA